MECVCHKLYVCTCPSLHVCILTDVAGVCGFVWLNDFMFKQVHVLYSVCVCALELLVCVVVVFKLFIHDYYTSFSINVCV